jgi:hypothetical protein
MPCGLPVNGGTTPEDKWPKDELERRPKDKRLKNEVQQLVKEEKKKRIKDKEEEPWTCFHSMTPPLSRGSRNFQGYQSKVETPILTMHGMMNCCSRMSGWPRN